MRSVGLTVLKTISCFSAVTFYSTSQLCDDTCFASNTLLGVLYFLSIIATPLFFLVNGYSDAEREIHKIEWGRVRAVIVIFTFWNVIGLFALNKIAQNSYFLQSWLLVSLASIYLLNPLFSYILQKERLALIALVMFIIAMFVLDVVGIFRKKALFADLSDSFRVWTWFFYYFLGRFLATRKWRVFTKQLIVKQTAFLGIVPIFIGLYFYEKLISMHVFENFNASYFLDSLVVIAATICTFILFDNITITIKWLKSCFYYIAPTMIGVYLLHDAVFFYVNQLLPAENATSAVLYLFLVFTISVLLVRLIMLNRWTAKLISI